MNNRRKTLLNNIILPAFIYSVLYFFSISFLTVLAAISPFSDKIGQAEYGLNIGFPFTYYRQFFLSGNETPNFGWFPKNLIADCVLTWIVTVLGLLAAEKLKFRKQQFR
jgi:hypothetical protein